MSAAFTLPYVWAEILPAATAVKRPAAELIESVAFYRRRTERLLRRYMFVSMQTGRVPSLIGNTVFRGKASHYRLRSFEDAVIFLFDIEKCLNKLDGESKNLIARIALQEYTQEEVAEMLGQSSRNINRRYLDAIDRLSRLFIDLELLDVS